MALVLLFVPITASAEKVPDWIKNNAGWWAEDTIGENDFLKSIEFLIDKKIIMMDYDPIYENTYEQTKISKKQLHSSISEAIENPIFNDKQFRVDVDGNVNGCKYPKSCLNFEPNQIKVEIILPNDEILDISPNQISFSGYYSTSGVKISSTSPDGVYEIRTSENGKLTKQEYFFIKEEYPSNVPNWIKNNAKWWADGRITDSDFLIGIKHLIKEKIIKFERESNNENLVDSRNADFSGDDLKPILYSITGEQLEAFLDLKKGNHVVLTPLNTDPSHLPVYFKITSIADEKFPLKLPFGNYSIKINNFKEIFSVGTFGHNSTVLKTVTDDNQVYCLGTYMSYEACMGFKNTKFEDYGIALSHQREWYKTKLQNSYDYPQYVDSYSNYDYHSGSNYGFSNADVQRYLDRAEYYANEWINDITPYAEQYVNGQMSYSEYERIGIQSFDYYSNQFVNEFDD